MLAGLKYFLLNNMNLTLTITWTPEEIKSITDFIHSKDSREKSLFETIRQPQTSQKKKPINKRNRTIDIYMGSIESWFALWKSYNTLQAAAHAVWSKGWANIHGYLKNDQIYKKIYKFKYKDSLHEYNWQRRNLRQRII